MGELKPKIRDDEARARFGKHLAEWLRANMPDASPTGRALALGVSSAKLLASYLDGRAAPSFGVCNEIYRRTGIDPLAVIGVKRPPQEGMMASIRRAHDKTLPPNRTERSVVKVLAGIRAECQAIARDASNPHKDRALATELETRMSLALAAEIDAGEL